MKHAAHKAMTRRAADMPSARSGFALPFFSGTHGSHSARAVTMVQTASGSVVETGISKALADELNAVAPLTRRSIRQASRAAQRKSMVVTSSSLAALVGAAATAMTFANPAQSMALARDDPAMTTTQLKRVNVEGVSRSEARGDLKQSPSEASSEQTTNEGTWQLDDANTAMNVEGMTRATANNAQVAAWLDGDHQYLPNGFDPNHASGDVGNAYAFSECTWWVYVRRHQLGLPVGSHMGNGNMWGNSARALGYWVDNQARHVGDIMVFAAGQDGTDATYGHVAVIEKINPDGSVQTSESGSVMNGATYSHTYSAVSVAQHDIIHY